ncbi:helix-turn-helix domain-containing protein [Pedobacter westerhofensis]|nr:helix-turn-helix domain-containing protein [Pedobacter westerhofensis]
MKNTEMAQKIKALRNRKGFSQEQLASAAQINLRTVQRIEAGDTEPRGDTLKRISSALDIDPDELIGSAEQEDNGFLAFLNISALCFILFPLLGIIVPLCVWMLRKDKIRNIGKVSKHLINFQMTWSLVFFIYWAIFTSSIMLGFTMPLPKIAGIGLPERIILIFMLLYQINIVIILINGVRSYSGQEVFYKPAIKFLK